MTLYVGTTIGGTRYLGEWYEGIKKLNANKICISRDISRCETIDNNNIDNLYENVQFIDFDSSDIWKSYELRHLDWKSDESILQGVILLLEDFINGGFDYFILIDSDVILDTDSIFQMTRQHNDYVQFCIPVVARDLPNDLWKDGEWQKHVMGFNDTTNFSISRRLAIDSLDSIKKLVGNAYPVDIRIQYCLKDAYERLNKDERHNILVWSKDLKHYIKGVRVNL